MGLWPRGWSIDIIATDISAEAIAAPSAPICNFFEAQRGVSEADQAWFEADDIGHVIVPHIRRLVHFRRFNLLKRLVWLAG